MRKECLLLTSHGDTDHMELASLRPTYVVQNIDNIFGHFTGGVFDKWFVTVANT